MKRNIIIVMTDQQRADLRKANGYAIDTMPFLDSFAKRGVDFHRAYTPQPTCMPARVSMFTGRYASAHRVRTNHNMKDACYETGMLEYLKENGYVTALCGKNHSHYENESFDFSETCAHLGHQGNMILSENEEILAKYLDDSCSMEIEQPAPGGVTAQHPYRNVSSAFKFIDEKVKENPFFLWISFAEPHQPYQVPEPYYDMFPSESLPPVYTKAEDVNGRGHKFKWIQNVWNGIMGDEKEKRINRSRSNYHGMLRLIDDQFKRLIEGLEERGIYDNTIVIFLSDHGDFAGEYGMMRKGPEFPEVICRIPMIWQGPGIVPQEQDDAHCVSLVDVFPTLCKMIDLPIPFGVQGKSILPILSNKDIPEKEFDVAYVESGFGGLYWSEEDSLTLAEEGACDNLEPGEKCRRFDCLNTWTQCGQVRMIRKGDYKIQVDMLGNGEMYNVVADYGETNNLYDDPGYIQVKAELLEELMSASLRACDPLPVPRRRYSYKRHPEGYWFQKYNE